MDTEQAAALIPLAPNAVIFTVLMALLIWIFPRKYAVIPFLLVACFITESQEILFAGFHFSMMRILIFNGIFRALIRKEHKLIQITKLDKIIILYALSAFFFYVIRELQVPAIGNRLGFLVNSLGTYFLLRFMIQDDKDMRRALFTLASITFVLSLFMIVENRTGRNFFSIFGLSEFSEVRKGKVRCQGSFLHALLAGAFGATQIPLLAVLIKNSTFKERIAGIAGVFGGLTMAVTSATSSGLFALMAGIFSLVFMWHMRYHMRLFRWGIVVLLIGLQICMKAPVWALIARFDLVGGSTGYHRFMVIDAAIKYFSEWWFRGVHETDHWCWECWDLTNQFVAEGVKGGFLTLVLFISIFVIAFKFVGRGVWSFPNDKSMQFVYWALGSALVSHLTAFWGMTYFGGQSYIGYYLLLCIISMSSYVPLQMSTAQSTETATDVPTNSVPAV